MKANKGDLKEKCENILIDYKKTNNSFGFFARYTEIYYPIKGIKIFSNTENISNSLKEVDYFLLENKKIAKFINYSSPEKAYRDLLTEYTLSDYKKLYKGEKHLLEFDKLIYHQKILI